MEVSQGRKYRNLSLRFVLYNKVELLVSINMRVSQERKGAV